MDRRVLVTGAAGGLGRVTVQHLAHAGWQVFAADLPSPSLDELAATNIVPIELDVTDSTAVASALREVRRHTDGLDGVVNFAGILVVGSMIEVAESDLARILDINLMGTVRVNQAAFDLVRARGGRIVNISSETGWQTAAPFNGPYAISKHAIEAYSDALRREAALLGVTVVKLQPGPFRTAMTGGIDRAFARAAADSDRFGRLLGRMGRLAARENRKAHDPALLAAVVAQALTDERPRIAYSVRPDRMRSALERLPATVADRLVVAGLRRLL